MYVQETFSRPAASLTSPSPHAVEEMQKEIEAQVSTTSPKLTFLAHELPMWIGQGEGVETTILLLVPALHTRRRRRKREQQQEEAFNNELVVGTER